MSIGLDSVVSLPAEVAGGKGHSLWALKRAGMPVPDGLIVPAVVHAGYLEAVRALSAEGQSQVHSTQDLMRVGVRTLREHEHHLVSESERLGPLLAVRSSAVCEDGRESSWSGMFDSYLRVTPLDVNGYVTLVWLSAASRRTASYSGGMHPSEAVQMAVLIQSMVASQVAGTCFSADPVTGDRGFAVVEAVPGEGAGLVSGQTTPARFEVHNRTREVNQVAFGHQVDEELVARVAAYGFEIERLVGYPVDIEWAADRDRVWILQARPITTI